MSLYPLGINRSRDLPRVARQSTRGGGIWHPETPPTSGRLAVRWVLANELAGAVLDAPQVPPEPLQHAAALDAVHRRICVLPLRFRAVPCDEADIRSLLETRHGDLLRRLDYLDGTCEMGLRIALPKCPAAQANPSFAASLPISYLNDRRAYYQRRDSARRQARMIVEHLVGALRTAHRDWKELAPSALRLIRLAFLVDQARVECFKTCLRASIVEHSGHQLTLLGPWPPYSFV